MHYYAVIRRGSEDELTHWKYIKKIKSKNGKTRYIYDRSELAKYENEVVEKKRETRLVEKILLSIRKAIRFFEREPKRSKTQPRLHITVLNQLRAGE